MHKLTLIALIALGGLLLIAGSLSAVTSKPRMNPINPPAPTTGTPPPVVSAS